MEEKTEFQLCQLLLIKKIVKTLRDEEKEIKLQIDEHLFDKSNTMTLLKDKESEFKQLSNVLEDVELSILKLENDIQKKKIEYAASEETSSYWQRKYDCAHASLDSASKAHDANKKIIQELENELEQISIKLVELRETRESEENVELSNSQVKRYMDLKTTAENRVKDIMTKTNDLTRNQQTNRDKLDNYNRRKQELEDKAKQITLMKDNFEERLRKLRNLNTESKTTITEMTTKRQKLSEKVAETKIKSSSLENEAMKVSDELREFEIDNYTVSHQMKKAETIKMLKQSFSGVVLFQL